MLCCFSCIIFCLMPKILMLLTFFFFCLICTEMAPGLLNSSEGETPLCDDWEKQCLLSTELKKRGKYRTALKRSKEHILKLDKAAEISKGTFLSSIHTSLVIPLTSHVFFLSNFLSSFLGFVSLHRGMGCSRPCACFQ